MKYLMAAYIGVLLVAACTVAWLVLPKEGKTDELGNPAG